jgi:hypothetical protein
MEVIVRSCLSNLKRKKQEQRSEETQEKSRGKRQEKKIERIEECTDGLHEVDHHQAIVMALIATGLAC